MAGAIPPDPKDSQKFLSRRSFLIGATVTTSATALTACGSERSGESGLAEVNVEEGGAFLAKQVVPFDGKHQAGVATPGQALLNMVAFNLRAGTDLAAVRRLMTLWTEDARRLTRGQNPVGSLEPELAESAANLTITCGFGPRFFDIIDKKDARPDWLRPLPEFSSDKLEDQWGQSDIALQICCDDPVTLAFATRHMIRSGAAYVETLWLQQGFLNAVGATEKGATPRNLFGQKDGTVNPASDSEYEDYVWINGDSDSPQWLVGGTAMVVRRINMNLDDWEKLDRTSREVAMGRFLDSGAPLSGTDEFEPADFDATDEVGLPIIDPRSHMALAAPPLDIPNQRIRRRAYNFSQPPVPGSEQSSNTGLVFVCFQQNPLQQFVPIQQRLNDSDRMNEWITHIGSAVYAVPPGTADSGEDGDRFWGAALLQS